MSRWRAKRSEIVEVQRIGYTMFGLTARRTVGTRIMRKLFPEGCSTWSGSTLFIDHRYVRDVIAAVGKRIRFVPTKHVRDAKPRARKRMAP